MVDYSRWNKIDFSDSEDDDNDAQGRGGGPTVTTLDHHEQVRIDSTGISLLPPVSSFSSTFSSSSLPPSSSSSLASKPPRSNRAVDHSDDWNKCSARDFQWRESKNEVFLLIPVVSNQRASELIIKFDSLTRTLSVEKCGASLLEGKLRYEIAKDPEDILDWELVSNSSLNEKYISIVLQKKSPLPNTNIWWSCVFEGDEEIDVTQIKARQEITFKSSASSSFAEAWKAAHQQFVDKASTRTKINIDDLS